MDLEPRSATAHVLPMLAALDQAVDAFVNVLEGRHASVGQRLVILELVKLARPAERANEPRHCRTGKGPAPRSSSKCPVAKRDSRNGAMRSGTEPVATKVAQAAPEAGMDLKPP